MMHQGAPQVHPDFRDLLSTSKPKSTGSRPFGKPLPDNHVHNACRIPSPPMTVDREGRTNDLDAHAIRAAMTAVSKYKTRNPFEIIEYRNIILRDICRFKNLLGYYVYYNRDEFIGINTNASYEDQKSAAAHELGHALVDGPKAADGHPFQDTRFYSTSNARAELRANTFAAELLLPDDFVLERIGYYEYNEMRIEIERQLPIGCSRDYRAKKYMEMMQDFYYTYGSLGTPRTIAAEAGVEEHLVDFKLRILSDNKNIELPQPPELESDFLKDVLKRH